MSAQHLDRCPVCQQVCKARGPANDHYVECTSCNYWVESVEIHKLISLKVKVVSDLVGTLVGLSHREAKKLLQQIVVGILEEAGVSE